MKTFLLKAFPLLAVLLPLAAFAAIPALADPLSVSLTPEGGASVLPGGTVVYDAVFTNPTGSDFLIDNATFSAADPATAGLLYPLFTGPYTAGVGTTSLTDVFELSVDPSLQPDTIIQGDLAFSGAPLSSGLPSGPDVEAASAPTQFQITPPPAVPEPSPCVLLALGLLPLGVAARRKMFSAPDKS